MTLSNNSQSESNDYAIGAIVFDRFRIMELIGSGAKGRVYKAMDTVLKNPVALKVLITDSRNERDLVRFQSEAKLASKMNHKNIATIYDFGLVNGVPFLSMELVEGDTLQSLLKKQSTLTLSEFLEIFMPVCDAITHAHNNSIVHRDIKPGNIVVQKNANETFNVKVLDFGVAKSLDSIQEDGGKLTPTGNLVGSPHYMSPEQAQGLKVTTKSDNYALGCVMWQCLTGEPPFHGDTSMETIWQHINETPPKLNEILDAPIPNELANVIEKLLSKKPEDRPSIKDVVIPTLFALQDGSAMPLEVESTPINVDKPSVGSGFTLGRKALFAIAVVALLFTSLIVMTVYAPSPELPKLGATQDNAQMLVRTAEQMGASRNQDALKGIREDPSCLIVRYTCKDDDLKKVINNPLIKTMDLSDNSITDKCFVYIAQVPNLQSLILNRTRVATLENLEKSRNIDWLELKWTEINDASVKHILPLKKLRTLRINDCESITDDGVNALCTMSDLTQLDLTGTGLTSKSSDHIIRLPKLTRVGLKRTNIDEAGARKILALPNLGEIDLKECPNISAERLAILETDFPSISFSEHPSVEYRLLMSARQTAGAKQFDPTMHTWDELIRIMSHRFGPNDTRIGSYYFQAGLFAGQMNRMDVCENYMNQSIKIYEAHRDYEAICNILAAESTLFYEAGNINKGHAFLERCVKIDEQSIGLKSPTLENRILFLAEHYRGDGQFAKAVPWFQKTIAIRDRNHGRRSVESVQPIVDLAETYRQMGKDALALPLYKQGLSIIESQGSEALRRYRLAPLAVAADAGAAYIYYRQKDLKTALKYSDHALELLNVPGIPLGNRAAVFQQRARLLKSVGRIDEAKEAEFRAAKLMAAQKKRRDLAIGKKSEEKTVENKSRGENVPVKNSSTEGNTD